MCWVASLLTPCLPHNVFAAWIAFLLYWYTEEKEKNKIKIIWATEYPSIFALFKVFQNNLHNGTTSQVRTFPKLQQFKVFIAPLWKLECIYPPLLEHKCILVADDTIIQAQVIFPPRHNKNLVNSSLFVLNSNIRNIFQNFISDYITQIMQ